MKSKLSTLWIFATLNFLYCDVVTLMDPNLLKQFLSGNLGGTSVSQGFLLGASVLVEIPIAMVLASRLLGQRAGRIANIAAGIVMTAVQLGSLSVKTPAPYYVFFSVIEIGCTATIVWLAWRWAGERATAVLRQAAVTQKRAFPRLQVSSFVRLHGGLPSASSPAFAAEPDGQASLGERHS